MIVKNESEVICRCLESVKPIIDYWVIVDTGSTDGTQEIVKNHMKNIPGELFERPWKNFGHNRTEAISLARGKGDYLFFIDADDWLDLPEGYQLPPLHAESYMVKFKIQANSFYKTQLVKASLPWEWIGVLHEYLSCGRPTQREILEGPIFVYGGDGASWNDPNKYLGHVKILKEALEEEPNNARYVFYLAQSYRDSGDKPQAAYWYNQRVKMGGWPEEVYCSLLQIGFLYKELNLPQEQVTGAFYKALGYRPHRPEPWYFLAECYNQLGQHDLAYATIRGWEYISQPETPDKLFLLDWTGTYGLMFQQSIAAYWLGKYEESLELCDKLLEMDELPEWIRDCTVSNRQFPLEKLGSLSQHP